MGGTVKQGIIKIKNTRIVVTNSRFKVEIETNL